MVNKMILQGRLTKDPELKNTPSGIEVATFTVAWSKKYKDTETKCFLPCVAWRQTGIFVNQYFSKGQEICVEGELTTRQYQDKDGNNRSITELSVLQAHFCGKKTAGEDKPQTAPAQTFELGEFEELEDDGELPF